MLDEVLDAAASSTISVYLRTSPYVSDEGLDGLLRLPRRLLARDARVRVGVRLRNRLRNRLRVRLRNRVLPLPASYRCPAPSARSAAGAPPPGRGSPGWG